MKKITSKLEMTTKVLLVAFLIMGASADSFSQKKEKKKKKEKVAKELVRPAKIGNAGVDGYVTSAFNLYQTNREITKKITGASGDISTLKKDLDSQLKEVTGLLGKSADVVKAAKAITPKTDSMKAVKAVSAGTKALNATKDAIPGQIEMIKAKAGK